MRKVKTRAGCDSCAMLRINGVPCHETGCPDAWRGAHRDCRWCGSRFPVEHARQEFCENSCFASFHGMPTYDEESAS